MDKLPTELVAQIASHLDHQSLLIFSSLNRRCRNACAPRKLRHVTIPAESAGFTRGIEDLRRAVDCQRHIRSLKIVHPDWLARPQLEPHPRLLGLVQYRVNHSRDYEYGANWQWRHAKHVNAASKLPEQDTDALLDFLVRLVNLTDLHWACHESIPSSIVKHAEDICCRLYMHHFHLDSIAPATGSLITLSAQELRLATSPALASLSRFDLMWSEGHWTAIMNLLLAAPNLSEVYLAQERLFPYDNDGQGKSARLGHWPRGRITPVTDRGHLIKFELRVWYEVGSLEWLDRYTDCRVLRCLKIHANLTSQCIIWLADSSQLFRNLCDLKLGPCKDEKQLVSFVTSLPSLRDLQLEKLSRSALESIVEACGNQLQRLHCTETFAGLVLLRKLLDHCQALESLGMGVYRAQGSRSELATYHQLARFPCLRELHLAIRSSQYWTDNAELSELKAAEPAVVLPYTDSWYLDSVYLACRDLACDQALANAVFQCISRQKAAFTSRLERLILEPSRSMEGGLVARAPHPLLLLLSSVALAWKCMTTYRDDSLHACVTAPFGVRPGPSNLPEELVRQMLSHFAPIIHRLWPRSQQMDIIAFAWHSFPMRDQGIE